MTATNLFSHHSDYVTGIRTPGQAVTLRLTESDHAPAIPATGRLGITTTLAVGLVAFAAIGSASAQAPGASPSVPEPAPGVSGLSAEALVDSDGFWHRIGMGDMPTFHSTEEVVKGSDLIVLGTPVDVRFYLDRPGVEGPDGTIIGAETYVLLQVAVDEAIKGAPRLNVNDMVDVIVDLPYQVTPEELTAAIPRKEQSMFLLYNLGKLNEEYGQPEDEVEATRDIYVRLNDPQGVLRNLEGKVEPVNIEYDDDQFPAMFAGRPFAELVAAIEQEAAKEQRQAQHGQRSYGRSGACRRAFRPPNRPMIRSRRSSSPIPVRRSLS